MGPHVISIPPLKQRIEITWHAFLFSPFHELLSSLSPARQIKVWPGEGKIESSGKGKGTPFNGLFFFGDMCLGVTLLRSQV